MKFAGLTIKVERTAYYAFCILVLIPFVVIPAYTLVFNISELSWRTFIYALAIGICLGIYHEVAQFIHQLGHALVAHATGFPMTGVRYEYIFSYSEYPPHEPSLPDHIHIQRSMGGVWGFTLMLTMSILLWSQVGVTDEFTRWLLNFVLFDSVILFIGGVIFSDGLLFVLQKSWKQPEPSTTTITTTIDS